MWQAILTMIGVHFLVLVVPGPNFLLVVRESVAVSRRNGIFTSSGISFGTLIYVSFGFLGFIAIISQSAMLFYAMKMIGAAYLIYLGIQAWRSGDKDILVENSSKEKQSTLCDSFILGAITTLSNPKAALFFLMFFTTLMPPDMPLYMKIFVIIYLVIAEWLWYVMLAMTFSLNPVQQGYRRIKRYVNYVFGGLFVYLGFRLAMAQK
jgi:RhtB (resistance to homoserine/threonine) family protein